MSLAMIGVDPTAVYTSTQFTSGQVPYGLGDRGFDDDGNEYVFVRSGGTAIAAQDCVGIRAGFLADALTLTNTTPGTDGGFMGCPAGVAMAAIAASGCGWVMVRGITTVKVAASCVRNTPLNTTAVAGVLDDDATAGAERLYGIVTTTTATGAAATACVVSYPVVALTL